MVHASAGMEAFFNEVNSGALLYKALPHGVAVTFDLHGPEGGVWSVDRRGRSFPKVVRRAVARPDCLLSCSVEDFEMLLNGQLTGKQGFLEGRLRVQGDVGLILRLQRLLAPRRD